jgi:hypothetical protein
LVLTLSKKYVEKKNTIINPNPAEIILRSKAKIILLLTTVFIGYFSLLTKYIVEVFKPKLTNIISTIGRSVTIVYVPCPLGPRNLANTTKSRIPMTMFVICLVIVIILSEINFLSLSLM